MPFLYIGSKSNALVENGIIYDSNGKPYYGSSCYDNYMEMVQADEIEVEILKEFDNYTDALNFESEIQKNIDVVADPSYFNLSIATVNNFSDPNYATYKNTITGKTVRLPKDHHMVISGIYVGVSKGVIFSESERKKRGKSGKENPFYGKKHTKESVEKMLDNREKTYKENPERLESAKKKMSESAKKTFTGVPKSEEHRKKIGRKNMIMLKNKDTGKTIRIPKSDIINYDDNLWVNPYILSENKPIGSRWTTDGVVNVKIKKGEKMPDGFWYGRTYNGWNDSKGKQE
jgi:hypothetical protein